MTPIARDVRESRRGLAYQIRGSGPAIVLVHGWCLDRTVWLYQEAELLDRGFQVVSVDLAGYGESSGLSGPFPLERHGDDIADLLKELDLREVTLVGFAFGAAVALSLPRFDRVARCVAIGIPSAAGAPYAKMRRAILRDWPRFAQQSARAICGRPQSEESLDWLGSVYAATPLQSALAGVDLLSEFEPLELAPGGRPPILFVHGENDTVVSPELSLSAARHFAGSEVRVVPDAGHFVPWDQPLVLAEIIAESAGSAKDET